MFKLKSKKLLLGILLCLCAAFFALLSAVSQKAYGYISCENDYGGSINMPTGANAIGNIVSSIDDKGNVKFDKTNLKSLAKKGGYDSLDKMVKAAEGGEIKTSADFGDTVVNFGSYEFEGTKYELTWIPVYLSQSDVDLNGDKKNDAILTLWLACTEVTNGTVSNQEVSTWTDGTYTDQEANPSPNNYSTSYIRVKTLNNGGTYYGSYTMWSTKDPTAYDYTATTDGSNKFEIVTTGALSGYIVTPNAVSWQKNANYTKNDPLWNGNSKGYYTQDGWLNDNIWLPSLYEVYDNTLQPNDTTDTYKQNGGLWQTGINSDSGKQKRSNSDYTWWRTAHVNTFNGAYKGSPNGSSCTNYALNKTPAAVRPALHLNISLLDPCEHKQLTAHAKETYCDKEGHEAYWECSDCGGLFSDAAAQTPIDEIVKVDALGHSKTPHAAQAATCTADGNVAYWSCSNCNKNLDANDNVLNSVVVTKTGHSMTSVSGVVVTCTSDGTVAHYHCSNCNFDFSDSAGNTKLDTTVIKSTGHNYVDKVTAPDCENGGYTTHTCSKCNDSYTDTNVPATGHTWGTPKWQWAANYLTCSAKFTCSTCNKEQIETASLTHNSATASCTVAGDTTHTASVTFNNNSYADSKVVSGQTLPHTWNLLSTSVPPDCENDGAGEYECTVCHKVETRAIDKLNHDFASSFTEDLAATCTQDGSKSKHCSRCSEKDEVTAIPATGHNAGAAATCTTPQNCTVCNTELSAATGHNWKTDWDTDTTNHWHECTVCNEKKDDEAHTYDWVITKDPTEDEEGEKEEYCTVCQYASGNKETIAKLVKDPEGNGDVIDLPVLPPNQDYDLEIAVKESDSLYNIEGITKGYKVELFVVDGENRTEYDNNKKVTLMLVIPEGMEDEFTLYCRHGEILERVDPASYTVNGKSVTIRTTLPNEYVFNAPAPEPEEPSTGIPWWVWLLVGLVSATLLTIIIVFIVVAKKKKDDDDGTPVDNGEVLSQLAEQGQKIDELLNRGDDGGFNTPVELDENGNVIFK